MYHNHICIYILNILQRLMHLWLSDSYNSLNSELHGDGDLNKNGQPSDSPIMLTREDVKSLVGSRYIVGNVIDAFLLMVATFSSKSVYILPNTFFTSIGSNLSAENLLPDNLLNYDFMFTVAGLKNHWVLRGINMNKKHIFSGFTW